MQNSKVSGAFHEWRTRWQRLLGGARSRVASPQTPIKRRPRCGSWEDAAGWDTYWGQALELSATQLRGYFCGIVGVVWLRQVLAEYAGREPARLLFMGNGLSTLPWAFAHAGHQSVILDVSRVATDYLTRAPVPEEYVRHYFQLQGSSFEDCHRPGGSVQVVCGSVFDLAAAPGPFDVIFSERSLQGFAPDRIAAAVRAISARLANTGSCYVLVMNSVDAYKHIESAFGAVGILAAAPGESPTDLSGPKRVLHLGLATG
ncbi:MAG TPA: class I SAM-dependent methyltransferase [Polyangiaceae bacterium]|nr:class I SAM-dependent methyltransferase [Polyangiaceae bacterium]